MGVIDDVVKKVKDVKDSVSSAAAEYNALPREYAAKASQMSDGKSAPAAKPAAAPKTDSGKRYGSGPGEKRIDVSQMTKPLGSYKAGTPYVPKTGIYQLHEGEAVTPKESNPMNASDAMAKLMGKKSKPEKKIHKITMHKADDGKIIHTHQHHHSSFHPDETHVSNNMDEANAHNTAQEPNMAAQPPAMPEQGMDQAA